ncbi:hypothetical protein ABLE92_17165 [Gordonia sp. VNQ95]|uniref:hypothetical protein n=1 Tax=Gordonia TaxID=2053 RepID=UPI0032B54108
MTIFIIALALLVTVPIAVLTYRTHRKVDGSHRFPLSHLVDSLTRDPFRPYGPDSDRIADELSILTRYHHDGA